jgi:transcription elongation GreA/GreB family factor
MHQELSRWRSQDSCVVRESLRRQVEEALERLSNVVAGDVMLQLDAEGSDSPCAAAAARVRAMVGFLGQVLAAWPHLPSQAFPEEGAGFGSLVVVVDADDGRSHTYTLMVGPLLDPEGGQVSLTSPMGQALLGGTAGTFVTVITPQRVRRLRVLAVRTLAERLQKELRIASLA